MSRMRVRDADGMLVVECDYEQRGVPKEIGGKWDCIEKAWVVAFTSSNVEYLLDHLDCLTISENIAGLLQKQTEKESHLAKLRELSKKDTPVCLRIPGLRTGCQLRNYQKIGVTYAMANDEGILIADDMGLGKENSVNTPVLTSCGWRPIGSLSVGDMVYSRGGTISKVIGVYPQGVKELLKVTFSDGFSCECGWDHLWIVQSDNNAKRKQGWRVLNTRQLSEDLYYKSGRTKWRIPLVEPIVYDAKEYIIPPYLMGVLLSDGSLTTRGVNFVPGDEEVPVLVKNCLPVGYDVHRQSDYGTSTCYSVVHKGRGFDNPIRTKIVQYGLDVTGERRFIPREYLEGSVEQRKQLLSGLVDTDGTVNSARSRFATCSLRLADDVIELVQSLGGMATKHLVPGRLRIRSGKQVQEQDCWQLVIRTGFNPFARLSCMKKWKKSSKLVRNIQSIEKIGMGEAVCIAVDSSDHSYVIQHHIVTHNTIQAIGTAVLRKGKGQAKNCLVITPASLKFNWPLEIEKFTHEKYVVIHGTAEERVAQWLRKDVFFYIVNYELLLEDLFGGKEMKIKEGDTEEQVAKKKARKEKAEMRKHLLAPVRRRMWDMIAIDEGHAIKSHSSARSRCVKALNAKFRMALTGTPLDGRLEELHSVMEFVNPGLLESRTRFLQKHAETDFYGKITGYKRIDEVKKRIEHCFIRRLKSDVLKELPDKIEVVRWIELSPEEKKIYKDLAEHGHEATKEAEAMVAVIRCKQFCDHYSLINEDCKKSSKLESLREVLEEVVVQNGHKVIVFSQYKTMVNILVELFDEMHLKYLRIDGDTPTKDRAAMQEVFNTDHSIDIMVGTDAMNAGLNFTGASYVINYDDSWAPAIMNQRAGRAHRMGQKNVVTVIGFACRDTIEERIRGVLLEKSIVTAEALGDNDEELVLKRIGAKDVAKLL